MLLLSAETSGRHGSIALARADASGPCEVIEVAFLDRGNFSEQLIPQIAALLTKHKATKNDIKAFVVASGPGSFTGLRVGLAAIKALAEVLAKPIATVSLLEAIAAAKPEPNIVAMDAGRKEIYVRQRDGSESLLTQEEFLVAARTELVVT